MPLRSSHSALPGRLGYSDQGKFNLVPMSYEALDYAAGGEREASCGVHGKKRGISPGGAGHCARRAHLPAGPAASCVPGWVDEQLSA